MQTVMKIIRLSAKLLILTAPLMLFSGLLTANPQLLGVTNARLMHTAVVPALFIPLLAIHSIAGILFVIMRNKNFNKKWVKATAVSAWSLVFIVFGSLYFASTAQTSEPKIAPKSASPSESKQEAPRRKSKPLHRQRRNKFRRF